MNKNLVLVVLGTLLFLSVILLILLLARSKHQGRGQGWQRRLRVQASATQEVSPDWASVRVAVVTENKSARQATEETNARMAKVLQAIKSFGIAEEDVTTSEYSLNPIYRNINVSPTSPTSPSSTTDSASIAATVPTIVGYNATQEATIILRDWNMTGPLLDLVLQQGVNNIRGINFEISPAKQELVNSQLRKEAIERAQVIATQEAKAAKVMLGKILTIGEPATSGGSNNPMFSSRMYALEASTDTRAKISPGTQTLSFTITMTYAIS